MSKPITTYLSIRKILRRHFKDSKSIYIKCSRSQQAIISTDKNTIRFYEKYVVSVYCLSKKIYVNISNDSKNIMEMSYDNIEPFLLLLSDKGKPLLNRIDKEQVVARITEDNTDESPYTRTMRTRAFTNLLRNI